MNSYELDCDNFGFFLFPEREKRGWGIIVISPMFCCFFLFLLLCFFLSSLAHEYSNGIRRNPVAPKEKIGNVTIFQSKVKNGKSWKLEGGTDDFFVRVNNGKWQGVRVTASIRCHVCFYYININDYQFTINMQKEIVRLKLILDLNQADIMFIAKIYMVICHLFIIIYYLLLFINVFLVALISLSVCLLVNRISLKVKNRSLKNPGTF